MFNFRGLAATLCFAYKEMLLPIKGASSRAVFLKQSPEVVNRGAHPRVWLWLCSTDLIREPSGGPSRAHTANGCRIAGAGRCTKSAIDASATTFYHAAYTVARLD